MKPEEQAELRRLTSAVLDKMADDGDVEQLEQRLLASAEARRFYLQLADVEARLHKGDGPPASVAVGRTSKPSRQRDARNRHSVLPTTRSRGWMIGFIIAASILAVVGLQTLWLPTETADVAERPFVLRRGGHAEFMTAANQWQPLGIGQTIGLGQRLRTTDEDDELVLRYEDGTEIAMVGPCQLVVAQSTAGGKQLELHDGQMSADVASQSAGRPLLIVTPHTTVRVLGTRFEIVATEQSGTRVDLREGRVELVRVDEEPVTVEPDSVAIIAADESPILVRPRSQVLSRPDRAMRISGLRSIAFTAGGTVLQGATSYQTVSVNAAGRVEMTPVADRRRSQMEMHRQDKSWLVFADRKERRLIVWDIEAQREQYAVDWQTDAEGTTPDCYVRAVSQSGRWLVTADNKGRTHDFRLHRFNKGDMLPFKRDRRVSSFQASPDGSMLAIGHSDLGLGRNAVELIDVASGRSIAMLPVKTIQPLAICFSADGQRLAVGLMGEVQVWDVASGERVATIGDLVVPVMGLALSLDGRLVAARTHSGGVSIWDVESKSELGVIDVGAQATALDFSPDGNSLAIVDRSRRLTVWNLRSLNDFSKIDLKSK